jgi:hypothetical protein
MRNCSPRNVATRFHAEEAAAAVLAAGETIAADLWAERGGEARTVSVPTREAATGTDGGR